MDSKVFNKIREIVYQKSGIYLGENKEALVSARIAKRMRILGVTEHKEYLALLLGDDTGDEMIQFLDVITTNVTSFYRENAHFDFLKQLSEDWIRQGQKRFRIWSAACSSGEEPYSIAMTLKNTGLEHGDVKILATDISTKVLEFSRNGEYKESKLKGVPVDDIRKYFCKKKQGNGEVLYTVRDDLKKLIVFKRLNLSEVPFPMKGPLDFIFCRNVMIYFDNIVRKNLLEECYRLLRPDGYLFVGHAESLTGMMMKGFRPVKPSVYTKN